MASIRKRGKKWQVQIRRQNYPSLSCSFYNKTDAESWARKTEASLESGRYTSNKQANPSLSALLRRYRDEVSMRKRGLQRTVTFAGLALFTLKANRHLLSCSCLIVQKNKR